MRDDGFYKKSFKILAILLLVIGAARVTAGVALVAVVLVGVFASFRNRRGVAICSYMVFPFLLAVSPFVSPKTGMVWSYVIRFGHLAIAMALILSAGRTGHGSNRLPFGMMFPFLLSACVGSATGWLPMVSYMKLVNFTFFLAALWVGTQNLQNRPHDLQTIRAFLFAVVLFFILGSALVYPFPQISFATTLRGSEFFDDAQQAAAVYREIVASGGKTLFCGITNHSQTLAAVSVLCCLWTLCDLVFVERRMRVLHLVLVLLALPMLYMCRSRVAFITMVAGMLMISFYTVQKVNVPFLVRKQLRSGLAALIVAIGAALAIGEVDNGMVSRWLRKTNDVEGDTRSLSEAMTSSRQGLMEYSMYEFRRNPLWGSGFQVAEYNRAMVKGQGLVLSASIEKGVLPVMVLGETGIVGSLLFLVFLVSFYVTASRRCLYVTITMFTAMFVANLGEAMFFAPGGDGSLMWMLTVVGGFAIDTVLLYERRINKIAASPKPSGRMTHREYWPSTNCREVRRA